MESSIWDVCGSNLCIVFEDVDIQKIISKLYAKRFKLCGQTCDALKRLIVHHSIFDEVVERLKEEIELKKIDDPENLETDTGSMVAER